MIDIHSHILSGFDDGADSIEVSLEMARRSREDGITRLVATPHVLEEGFSELKKKVGDGVATLRDALAKESIQIDILPGAELNISSALLPQPEEVRELTLGFLGKYVLLELPLQEMPRYTHELVFKLLLKGLIPILAHPERNLTVMERTEELLELVGKGSLVQVNAGSITGKYGERVRNAAELILRNRIVHFIASDAHSLGNRPPGLSDALERARQLIGDDAGPLVEENPSAVLDGRTLEFRAPKRLERPRRRFLSWLSGRSATGLS
jgi:protein-tyrosine phosphatase